MAAAVPTFWIVQAKTPRGEIPVGTIAASRMEPDPKRFWPRFDWFKWASLRNKLEGALGFLAGPGKGWLTLYPARQEEKRFCTHVCRYGAAQRVGTVIGWFGEADAALFQSRQTRDQPARS